jgi:hypothetical protein
MTKDLERLINPPWLDSINKLRAQGNLATLAFNQSEFMKSARLAAESSKLASEAFRESEAMRSVRKITESSRFAAIAIQESQTIKSLMSVIDYSRLASNAFQESVLAKQYSKTSQLASIAREQSESFSKMAQLNNLASFKALASLKNSPFSNLITPVHFPVEYTEEASDEYILEIDAELSKEVSTKTDFNDLSDNTKRILTYLYHYYFLPILLSCISGYILHNALEAQKELETKSSPYEIKSFVRSANGKIDRLALKSYRVTTARSLNFRSESSMKSEIITTLPIGSLVEVVDKSHRSWILVEVEIDGELEQGWISRRYTAYFK